MRYQDRGYEVEEVVATDDPTRVILRITGGGRTLERVISGDDIFGMQQRFSAEEIETTMFDLREIIERDDVPEPQRTKPGLLRTLIVMAEKKQMLFAVVQRIAEDRPDPDFCIKSPLTNSRAVIIRLDKTCSLR